MAILDENKYVLRNTHCCGKKSLLELVESMMCVWGGELLRGKEWFRLDDAAERMLSALAACKWL
jgi:hypothetical protein